MRRVSRLARWAWLTAFAMLVLQGCASESNDPQVKGKPDRGVVIPKVQVDDVSPMHLSSMAKPDTTITMDLDGMVSHAEALKAITAATTVTTWPDNKPVTGTWGNWSIAFKPAAPLTDGDYLVRIKPDGDNLKVEREYTLFHVGSLPRVKQVRVGFGSSTAIQSKTYESVFLWMSEPMDPSKWTLTVETKQGGTFKALTTVNTSGHSFKLSAPLDVSAELRVTLGTEVGATSGLKLDGKYTGQPGSGAFTATFVPKDHLERASGEMVYVPDIKF